MIGAIHVHSTYSHDGRDTPEDLRAFAASRGIAFLGLTDHAEDLSADEWTAYVAHCRAASDDHVRLVPGLEFRFSGYPGLHLLAVGLDRWIQPETPADFVRLCADTPALTIVAHPILANYAVPDEVRAGVNAIEVWNASYNTRYLPDPRAIRLLHDLRRTRPDVVGTVGLDQHDCRNDRETRVIVLDPGTAPIEALRHGRFYNRGRTMRFGADVAISGLPWASLVSARWLLDRVERTQNAIMVRARR